MALFRDNASSLLVKAEAKELHELLAQQARVQFSTGTGVSELRSWELSLPEFLADLQYAGLGHVEVLLEHKLPYTPKRVDALLCGVHPTTRSPSYVLVELRAPLPRGAGVLAPHPATGFGRHRPDRGRLLLAVERSPRSSWSG